jgi:Tol biopolymer transport system component
MSGPATAGLGITLAFVLWLPAPAPRCGGGTEFVARQALNATTTGIATVDVSADGRYVAFVSLVRLAAADDNVVDDVYVLDRETRRVTLESVAADGRASDGSSVHPRLSGDGRFVVYATVGTRLLGMKGDLGQQIVRRDRLTGISIVVSRTGAGRPANGWSTQPDISHDGRYVVFESTATDLVGGADANGSGTDVYLFDAVDGSTRRISVTTAGGQPGAGDSYSPAIDAAGRRVAFTSTAPLEGAAATAAGRGLRHVFLRDLATRQTHRVSATRDGRAANGASYYPAISADGRRVAFVSSATDLEGALRRAPHEQVYLYDVEARRLRLVTRSASGGLADGGSRHPALNADGRYLVVGSDASNLHCAADCEGRADLNLVSDIYRLDTVAGVAERVSGAGLTGGAWWTASTGAAIDGSGRVVAFSSRQATDEDDLDHDDDVFVEVLPGPGGSMADMPDPPCVVAEYRPDGRLR